MGSIVLLDLMGGVALLLWGLHMVQSGILRAFGPSLRHWLSKTLGNRLSAFAAGLGLTTLLQSSTATAMMTQSFVAQGLVGLVPALAILLGANVGTTLIVMFLSYNVTAITPALFIAGLVAFRSGAKGPVKDLGRVSIGLGLILLALHILLDTLAPAESAPSVRALLTAVTGDPVMCILLAAVLTWAAHSSVATVLLVMSLSYSHFVTTEAALALVLGANLGSALNPVLEGTHADLASYRLPVGNLINRLLGIAIVTPFLHPLAQAFQSLQPDAAKLAAEFHLAFNAALAIAMIGLLGPLARALERLFPVAANKSDEAAPRYLDENALQTPTLALADASREALRMADIVEEMLRKVMQALLTNDRDLVREVARMDDTVDKLDEALKLYMTQLTRGSLDEREGRRAMEIVSFSINMEHAGDIIDKNLSELAAKKIKRGYRFSDEGQAEIDAFQRRVLESLRLALSVFMSSNADAARQLLKEKAALKAIELSASDRHLERLRDGRPETLMTTSIHLDVLRDLRRIHSHICATAYPALYASKGAGEERGEAASTGAEESGGASRLPSR